MQPVATVRGWHLEQLRRNINLLSHILDSAPANALTAKRDGGDGWTVMEVLGHLHDFEEVFLQRSHVTVTQEMGELPFPDQNELVQRGNYNHQDRHVIFQEWMTRRQKLLDFYSTCSEEQWSKEAKHPRRGPMSLTDQLALTVWHDNNHLDQIVKILKQP